jgi:hypothetical protein
MITFGTFLKLCAVVAVAAAVSSNAEPEWKTRYPKKRNGKLANQAVCDTILESWWPSRQVQRDTNAQVSAADEVCGLFDGDMEACIGRRNAKRIDYSGVAAGSENELMETSCIGVGANSPRCISNPCFNLNTGECGLGDTYGLCRWWTRDEVRQTDDTRVQVGCQRNPCHMGGYGRISDSTCFDLSVRDRNGGFLAECTRCTKQRDRKFKGLGVGCQMTVPTTSGKCAPVSGEADLANTFVDVSKGQNNNCMCENVTAFCAEALGSRSGSFVPYQTVFP